MSRPSLNSNLTALARRAGELRFDDSPIARQQFDESRVEQFKNCYAVPQGFVVKQYLAGSQRTLGLFEQKFGYFATRFADLCIARFWKYRKTTRGITDSDLNYSLEIANSALAACPEAMKILDDIELFLSQRFQVVPRAEPRTPAYPIALSASDELIIEKWAIDGRLWATQQTRVFNLKIIVREILGNQTRIPIIYRREIPDPEPITHPDNPVFITTSTPNPDSAPVTTTGGDPGPVTISPLFSK